MGVEVGLPDFLGSSKRLGFNEDFTEGNTEVDWARKLFEISDLPKFISWEEFDRKGYYIINVPDDYKSTPGLRWFAEGRPCDTPDPNNPKRLTDKADEIGTYSGKIEFASESLRELAPEDTERPISPHYICRVGRGIIPPLRKNIPCNSCPHIRASLFIPITTATPRGSMR